MKFMTAYKQGAIKQGDILLIPFPFTDLTAFKKRPCIVISSNHFSSRNPDIIAAAITSQIPNQLSFSEYKLSAKEQSSCGLPKPSIIKLGKIVTLDQRLIRKKLGKLQSKDTPRVLTRLKKVFKI